ncbi:NADH-quinone oxidoreductase subunit C [[Eubacterium] cellulosolvens]
METTQEKDILQNLRTQLGEAIIEESRMAPDRPIIKVSKEKLIETLKILVENHEARLCTISAVDNGLDFELIYHMSIKGLIIHVKTSVMKEESKISSVTGIIPGAMTVEREIWDLFQIEFDGISDPRPLTLPKEWRENKTAPLRKPMGGIVAEYQKPTVETLMEQGQVFTMPSTVKTNRENMQLPEVQTTMNRPEALKEIQEVARLVKFDEKVGYNWDKKKLRY